MENYLISEAIGDIAGSAYEGRAHRIKDYDKVKIFSSRKTTSWSQKITLIVSSLLYSLVVMQIPLSTLPDLWFCKVISTSLVMLGFYIY